MSEKELDINKIRKRRNRMKFWAILLNPFLLLTVAYMSVYTLRFFEYGGTKTNAAKAFIAGVLCLTWLVVWIVVYFVIKAGRKQSTQNKDNYKDNNDDNNDENNGLNTDLQTRIITEEYSKTTNTNASNNVKKHREGGILLTIMLVEIVVLLAITAIMGVRLHKTANDITTKLGYYIYEKNNTKNITLENNNLLTNKFSDTWNEIAKKSGMPEVLYIENAVQVNFDKYGEIQYIYAFVYGKDKNGKLRSYLVDYDTKKSEKVIVWIDNYLEPGYSREKLINPMVDILDRVNIVNCMAEWNRAEYKLLYAGERVVDGNDGSFYTIDEKGNINETDNTEYGYEVSISVSDSCFTKKELAHNEAKKYVNRYFASWDITAGISVEEATEEIAGESDAGENNIGENNPALSAHELGVNITNREDGSVYYYISQETGYCMYVADAAAGSRFYILKKTEDGGNSWNTVCEDPCLGETGASPTMDFSDENNGSISLPNASGEDIQVFETKDGGKTFVKR